MGLGAILKEAAKRDLSAREKKGLLYSEEYKDGRFEIRLSCDWDKEAFVECSIPSTGFVVDEEENYLRLYFLSMVYNAAMYGQKRMKQVKRKDIPLELRQLENYCESKKITPQDLINAYEKRNDKSPNDY